MSFDNEMKLILLSSRVTFDEKIKKEIENLMNNNLDWNKIINFSFKNKVLHIVFSNLVNLGYNNLIPKSLREIIDDSCSCNFIRNTKKLSELRNIQVEMQKRGISIAPVKGGYLVDSIYKGKGARTTNDIDFLFKKSDLKSIDEIMKGFGYQQGDYNKINNSIILPDIKKKMLYRISMYNLLHYIKLNHDIPIQTVICDYSFALDLSLNTKPVEEMLEMTSPNSIGLELLPEHFFIHLCCNNYNEATNVVWILNGNDMNLIKYCDVREFVLQKMNADSIAKAITFAKKYGLEKAVYFTIYFTKKIYNDGYEDDILNSLNIEDETFLYQFGEKDYGKPQQRKKDFFESLFSDNNRDEIDDVPNSLKLIRGEI